MYVKLRTHFAVFAFTEVADSNLCKENFTGLGAQLRGVPKLLRLGWVFGQAPHLTAYAKLLAQNRLTTQYHKRHNLFAQTLLGNRQPLPRNQNAKITSTHSRAQVLSRGSAVDLKKAARLLRTKTSSRSSTPHKPFSKHCLSTFFAPMSVCPKCRTKKKLDVACQTTQLVQSIS